MVKIIIVIMMTIAKAKLFILCYTGLDDDDYPFNQSVSGPTAVIIIIDIGIGNITIFKSNSHLP